MASLGQTATPSPLELGSRPGPLAAWLGSTWHSWGSPGRGGRWVLPPSRHTHNVGLLLAPGSGPDPAPVPCRYHLAVTRHHENEPTSSSIYAQNDPWEPLVSFEGFLRNNETIEDQVTARCHRAAGTESGRGAARSRRRLWWGPPCHMPR